MQLRRSQLVVILVALCIVAIAVVATRFLRPHEGRDTIQLGRNGRDSTSSSSGCRADTSKHGEAKVERESCAANQSNRLAGDAKEASGNSARDSSLPAPRHPKDLPLGKAEPVRPPRLSAKGKDDQSQVWIATPELESRYRGQNPNTKGETSKSKSVHGYVYEVRGAQRIPLEGVEVLDFVFAHRTFTDPNGRFEFHAQFRGDRETSEDYDVQLIARAPGYVLYGNSRLVMGTRKEVESDGGIKIHVVRVENETVRVKITNFELARGDLTVTLAAFSSEYGNDFADVRMAVSVVANEQGEALFSIPPDSLILKGVSGDGVRMDWSTNPRPRKTDDGKIWEVALVTCENYQISGCVTDLRNDAPLKNTLINGKERNETTLTNVDGRFSLWLGAEPDQYITVSALGYTCLIFHPEKSAQSSTGSGTVTRAPGAGRAGPWNIALRPWVKASLSVTVTGYSPQIGDHVAWLGSLNEAWPGFPREALFKSDGSFEFARIPWGITDFRLVFERDGRRSIVNVEVLESEWTGQTPWTLTGIVKQR